MTLSERICDIEAALAALSSDLEDGGRPTANECLRIYVLRAKLDGILAGGHGVISADDARLYEMGYSEWRKSDAAIK